MASSWVTLMAISIWLGHCSSFALILTTYTPGATSAIPLIFQMPSDGLTHDKPLGKPGTKAPPFVLNWVEASGVVIPSSVTVMLISTGSLY